MIRIIVAAVALLLICPAFARDFGQWAQIDQKTREWFRSQKNPTTGVLCCSEADGVYAEEDIRGDQYWVRFEAAGTKVDWMSVPPEVVIHDANRNGAPVVWWYWLADAQGSPTIVTIRCFAPGGGV